MSRLADESEEIQLRMGAELLDHAEKLLANRTADAGELRFLSERLREALRDVLRVADSRGRRLPASTAHEPDGSPMHEGEAFE